MADNTAETNIETFVDSEKVLDEDVVIAESDEGTGEEQSFTDTDERTEEEVKEKAKEEKAKQTKEQNHEYAEKRRQERALKEEQELRFLQEYVGENPYTNEPIKTARDVKVYKTMKQIEKDGGDPIVDYHKYAGREEQRFIDKEKESSEKIRTEVIDFKKEYPDVNLKDLQSDSEFKSFSGKLIGKVPIKDIYESYVSIKGAIKQTAEKTAKEEIAKKLAKDESSAGSLSAKGAVDAPIYTLEQIGKMSQEELNDNWEAVSKAYDYWQTHKK